MESAKLKNIILTILIITNALLLGLVIFQEVERRQSLQKTLDDAVALLAERGISVRAEDLPGEDFPAPLVLERDTADEQERFAALLGPDTVFTQRGLVSVYESALGRAEVQGDGSFSVTFSQDAQRVPDQDTSLGDFCSETLAALGYTWRSMGDPPREDASAVTLYQWYPDAKQGCVVFSCQAVLTFDEGRTLRSITGTRLAGRPTANSQAGQSLSTATLLVRFRANIIDSGDACSAILSARQGYVLSGDANGKLQLTPVLWLETDTNLYIVNALNGQLRRA